MGRYRKGAAPAYRHHKASGQAVVTIAGRQVYLGVHDSPESHREYNRLIGGLESILTAFMEHARTYYRKPDGTPTTETREYAIVVDLIRRHASILADVGPGLMRTLREQWIAAGLTRRVINQRLGRVPRLFRWAAGEGLCDPSIPLALNMAPRLRQDRSKAIETTPVPPAPLDAIQRTLGALESTWADAVRVQLLTGARPGEVLGMRAEGFERFAGFSIYRVAFKRSKRAIIVPGICQALIDSRATRGYIFPGRGGVGHRSTSGYAHAVLRVCRLRGIEPWHPHQLRHTFATAARAAGMRVEDVQVALGHKQLSTTEIYAERDLARIAELLGSSRVPLLSLDSRNRLPQ